jgi:hypothetical protein
LIWIICLFGFFILYALFLLALYILTIYALVGMMRIIQFLVLRIIEFDKGPLLAMAALLTGIGAVAKAFAG